MFVYIHEVVCIDLPYRRVCQVLICSNSSQYVWRFQRCWCTCTVETKEGNSEIYDN